MDFSSKLLDMG